MTIIQFFCDGARLAVSHTAKKISSSPSQIALPNVLVVPKIKNLLSISELTKYDTCLFEFSSSSFTKGSENRKDSDNREQTGGSLFLGPTQTKARFARYSKKPLKMFGMIVLSIANPPSPKIATTPPQEVSWLNAWLKTPIVCTRCQLGENYKLPFPLHSNILTLPFQKYMVISWDPLLLLRRKILDTVLHLLMIPLDLRGFILYKINLLFRIVS